MEEPALAKKDAATIDKKEKKLSPEELLESVKLTKVEEEHLLNVWKHLVMYDK